jgi:shikimate dehydrogenase
VNYFDEKFKREGIEATYKNFPLSDISEFSTLIRQEDRLAGLNVTVPYKQQVIPYLDALSKTARLIQAVNTIRFCRKEDRLALVGHNTDVIGFRQSLEEHLQPHHTTALVLGSGGSSKAVLYVLQELGISYQLVSRSGGEDRLTYSELDEEVLHKTKLIINTTPLGMFPRIEACPDLPYQALDDKHLLFDLVYNPAKTRFLSLGEEQGAATVNGYDMLVNQAEGSWEIWNK